MTIVGPSKSTWVISTWSGTTFLTTLLASLRISSMLIDTAWARGPSRSRQLHRCLAPLDLLVVERLVSVLGDDRDVDPFARDGVPLHRRGDGPGVWRGGGAAPRRVDRVHMPPVAVPATDHELDPVREVPAPREDVRREGRAGFHGHGDAPLELVEFHLRGDVPREDLEGAHEAGRREAAGLGEPVS